MNKLPPTYCLVTTTLSASGKVVVLIVLSPILAIQSSYKFDLGDRTTIAYSVFGERCTGDGNLTFVATVPSIDVVISDGSSSTSACSAANSKVGVPNSTVLISTLTFSTGSTLAKNKSTDDTNAPVSSHVNDCARGSQRLLRLTITLVRLNVSTIPVASYVVSAELIIKLPLSLSAFVSLDDNLNVFVPEVNLNGGNGLLNGSLKKIEPVKSPKVSGINLTLDTVAWAPLVSPRRVIPSVTNPKYLPNTSSTKELTSIFNIVDDDEYTEGNSTLLSYGFKLYVDVGLAPGPLLWLGAYALALNKCVDPTYPFTVSPIINDPEDIAISVSLGARSIPLVPSKNAYCLPSGLNPEALNATFLDLICVSGSLLILTVSINVKLRLPLLTRLVPPSTNTLLTQVSDSGFKVITPVKSIILNGFTFSTLDANGCVIQSFSVYLSVILSPVFWTLESSNSRSAEKSAVSVLIEGSSATSGDIE